MPQPVTAVVSSSYDNTTSTPSSFPSSCDGVVPDLAAVMEAWPSLPGAVRAGIVAMVKAAGDCKAGGE